MYYVINVLTMLFFYQNFFYLKQKYERVRKKQIRKCKNIFLILPIFDEVGNKQNVAPCILKDIPTTQNSI